MNQIVLDSCVFSKLFIKEADSHQAHTLIEHIIKNNIKIIVPSLFVYEVLATVTIGNYSVNDVYEILMDFQNTKLQLIEMNKTYVEKILKICSTGHIKSGFPSFYDACYHALAMIYDCYFITADKRHFSKTHQLGNIVLLSDWQAVL